MKMLVGQPFWLCDIPFHTTTFSECLSLEGEKKMNLCGANSFLWTKLKICMPRLIDVQEKQLQWKIYFSQKHSIFACICFCIRFCIKPTIEMNVWFHLTWKTFTFVMISPWWTGINSIQFKKVFHFMRTFFFNFNCMNILLQRLPIMIWPFHLTVLFNKTPEIGVLCMNESNIIAVRGHEWIRCQFFCCCCMFIEEVLMFYLRFMKSVVYNSFFMLVFVCRILFFLSLSLDFGSLQNHCVIWGMSELRHL